MCEFLEPYYKTTNLILKSNYPASNFYFMQVWKFEFILNANLTNEDGVTKDMSLKTKV